MADLGRQLHEYLSQSKSPPPPAAAAAAAPTPSPQPLSGSAAGGGLRAWLGAVGGAAEAEAEPCLPALSGWQRLAGGALCSALAALCFVLAALCLPLLLLRARRFALLWALGSLCGLGAAALWRGPARLLREPGRGAVLYLLAVLGTLYAALGLRSTALTALGAAAQLGIAAGVLLAALPGGTAGLRRLAGLLRGKVLPL